MYDISLILRRNAQKRNGEFPINLRLKIDNCHSKIYATNVAVSETNWDENRLIVKKSDPLFFTKNETLKEKYSRAEKILLRLNIDGKVSYANFESEFIEEKPQVIVAPKTCYFQYCRDYIELNKAKWKPGYVCHYYAELTKLKKYQTEVYVEDIDIVFLGRYEKYMREELGNVSNTVHKTYKFMKPVLRDAVNNNILSKSPFSMYSVKKEPTNRDYLTIDELHQLEGLLDTYRDNKKIHNVLTYFLFACYTGLRFSDLADLKHGHIINGTHIELIMHKTRERVTIPLSNKAKTLLPETSKFHDLKIFRVLSNQKSNDYLKCIAVAAGINKTVTCHVARHTFATISLTLGISLPVVSKLLGHTDIKTTQIYAKIIDQKKFDEMNKWDQYFDPKDEIKSKKKDTDKDKENNN